MQSRNRYGAEVCGVQTVRDQPDQFRAAVSQNVELKMLGRIHTWEQFLKTYELARSGGFSNINVDLMSSLPGQHIETMRIPCRRSVV